LESLGGFAQPGAAEPAEPAAAGAGAAGAGPGPGGPALQPWASRRARPASRSRLPVYVMLPLDTVTRDGVLANAKALAAGFQARPPGADWAVRAG